MAFAYQVPTPAHQETPTFGSKQVLAKSALINIAAGSGGATATDYEVGIVLPKTAQILAAAVVTTTAVSGGTISASTLTLKATNSFLTGYNVFAAGGTIQMNSAAYFSNLATNIANDYPLYYTLTHTGTGPATAGIIYVTVFYVV
jgi:hypothetical protein